MVKASSYRNVPTEESLVFLQLAGFALIAAFFAGFILALVHQEKVEAYFCIVLLFLAMYITRRSQRKYYHWYIEVLDGGRVYDKSRKKHRSSYRFYIDVEGLTRVGALKRERKQTNQYTYDTIDLESNKIYRYKSPKNT